MNPTQTPGGQSPIPAGFRSGVITAITVVLGFSFLFLRSWFFELPGDWTSSGVFAGILLVFSITLQLTSLWRSLQPEDEQPDRYRITLRWFLVAVLTLLISVIAAALSYSGAGQHKP
jgi:hypothetical protein